MQNSIEYSMEFQATLDVCCENFNIYLSYFQINNFCADLQIIYYDNITNIFESISSCNLLSSKYFKMDSMLKTIITIGIIPITTSYHGNLKSNYHCHGQRHFAIASMTTAFCHCLHDSGI